MTGIHAELRISSPADCPIAGVSQASGSLVSSVSRSSVPGAHGQVTEEFVVADAAAELPDFDPVFSYGSRRVFRFRHQTGRGCPCELVESFGCPVVDVHARNGDLCLEFHVSCVEDLRSIVSDLRESYPVNVQRLVSSDDAGNEDLVFVDRSELTDRQREVLERAHTMGYFDHPKGANAGEVADALGITTSTFTEHLAAAQRKLLRSILGV
ncbi:MAG: helix-turn-helix domain-containing protein [Halobacteriales archaeon]|nr:helix-turn-helix domain-containing protein [Halobacteriales archaeon]